MNKDVNIQPYLCNSTDWKSKGNCKIVILILAFNNSFKVSKWTIRNSERIYIKYIYPKKGKNTYGISDLDYYKKIFKC